MSYSSNTMAFLSASTVEAAGAAVRVCKGVAEVTKGGAAPGITIEA
jgi:hypothetical protein